MSDVTTDDTPLEGFEVPAPEATESTATGRRKTAKARAPKADTAPKRGRPTNAAKRVADLEAQLGALTVTLVSAGTAFGQPAYVLDGLAVAEHGESIAAALGAVAEKNAAVAKILDASVEGSVWLGLVVALAPLAIAVANNHGIIGTAPTLEVDTTTAPPSAAERLAAMTHDGG